MWPQTKSFSTQSLQPKRQGPDQILGLQTWILMLFIQKNCTWNSVWKSEVAQMAVVAVGGKLLLLHPHSPYKPPGNLKVYETALWQSLGDNSMIDKTQAACVQIHPQLVLLTISFIEFHFASVYSFLKWGNIIIVRINTWKVHDQKKTIISAWHIVGVQKC